MMKKIDLHNTHFARRAKRTLCLLLALLSLAGDVALPKADAADDYVHSEKMYVWHQVKGKADLPTKKEWVPIILGYWDKDGSDEDMFIRDPMYYKWDPKDSDCDEVEEYGVFTDEYMDAPGITFGNRPACAASTWYHSLDPSQGQYPYLCKSDASFRTRGDVLLSTWGIYYTGMTDDEGHGFATYAIGRNIDYSKKTDPKAAEQVLIKEYEASQHYGDFYDWASGYPKWDAWNGMSTGKKNGGVKWTIITKDIGGDDEGYYRNLTSVRLRYFVKGGGDIVLMHWRDRVFTNDGSKYEYGYDGIDQFYLWWGEEVDVTTYSDVTYETGTIHNIRNEVLIEEGATLTVEPGAVLSISADLYNNGTILNYGTIVVQEGGSISALRPQTEEATNAYLDKYVNEHWRDFLYPGYNENAARNVARIVEAQKAPYTFFSEDYGKIYCSGGPYTNRHGQKMNAEGNLLVLKGGTVIFSEGADLFRVENGATVELGGVLLCPNAFRLADSDFYIRRGGILFGQYRRGLKYQTNILPKNSYDSNNVRIIADLSPTPIYVSGHYKLINDGEFKNAGKAIREATAETRTFRDITTVEGSGTYTAMSPVVNGTWTQTVGSGGIKEIKYDADGNNQIFYDNGTTVKVRPDGTSAETCSTQYRDASILRDADGWYLSPNSNATRDYWEDRDDRTALQANWSYVREYTSASKGESGTYVYSDSNLISESYYDANAKVYYTYYYKDQGDMKAGQATVVHKDGTTEIYTYKKMSGKNVLDKKVGMIQQLVNAAGDTRTVSVEHNVYFDGNNNNNLETFVYKDRTEMWLVDHVDQSIAYQNRYLMSVEYTAGRYAGKKITYTIMDGDGNLGGYGQYLQGPSTIWKNTDYTTLWRVWDGQSVYVCVGKGDGGKQGNFTVFARNAANYDPAQDTYYVTNKVWTKVKELDAAGNAIPNAENFLKGWPY